MSPEPLCISTAVWRCYKALAFSGELCRAAQKSFIAGSRIYANYIQLLCAKTFAKTKSCVIGGAVIPAGAVALIGSSLYLRLNERPIRPV